MIIYLTSRFLKSGYFWLALCWTILSLFLFAGSQSLSECYQDKMHLIGWILSSVVSLLVAISYWSTINRTLIQNMKWFRWIERETGDRPSYAVAEHVDRIEVWYLEPTEGLENLDIFNPKSWQLTKKTIAEFIPWCKNGVLSWSPVIFWNQDHHVRMTPFVQLGGDKKRWRVHSFGRCSSDMLGDLFTLDDEAYVTRFFDWISDGKQVTEFSVKVMLIIVRFSTGWHDLRMEHLLYWLERVLPTLQNSIHSPALEAIACLVAERHSPCSGGFHLVNWDDAWKEKDSEIRARGRKGKKQTVSG